MPALNHINITHDIVAVVVLIISIRHQHNI